MSLTNTKVSALVGSGTSATGVATWLDWIPDDVGKLATVVGICLSAVLIMVHIRKMKQDARESALREELLLQQIEREKGTR